MFSIEPTRTDDERNQWAKISDMNEWQSNFISSVERIQIEKKLHSANLYLPFARFDSGTTCS